MAEDIEQLTILAYSDAAEPIIAVLAKDQFIDSLAEENTRLWIQSGNLWQALEACSTGIGIVCGSEQKK